MFFNLANWTVMLVVNLHNSLWAPRGERKGREGRVRGPTGRGRVRGDLGLTTHTHTRFVTNCPPERRHGRG